MKRTIDRVLISSDNNPYYIDFLPVVSLSWQKILGIKPTLAYVTDQDRSIWKWMENYCQDIMPIPVDKKLPDGKCRSFAARMIMRYKYPNDICMVSDLDMIPLASKPFENIMEEYKNDRFVSFGYNVFEFGDGDPESNIHNPNLRKFPSCYTVASGETWMEIINPLKLSDDDLIKSWYNIRYYDHKESVNRPNFCDESLMRALIQGWDDTRNRVVGIDREMSGRIMVDRLDRNNWSIDFKKLSSGGYIDAHCPRPMSKYSDDVKLLTEYLDIPFVVGG